MMDLEFAYIIDIETAGLLSDMLDYSSFPYTIRQDASIWCVVIRNIKTGDIQTAEKEFITKAWFQECLKDCSFLIAHNGIKFDFIVLKLLGLLDYTVGYLNNSDTLFDKPVKFLDTLIISRLLNPDRYGGHSLGSWGERVGAEKTDFRGLCISKGYIDKMSSRGDEFKQYVPEMLSYCEQDTEVNRLTFLALLSELAEYNKWNQAIKMEHKLADLAIRRESLGFYFDKELAVKCLEDLTEKMQVLTDIVNPLLPKKLMTKGEVKKFMFPKNQFVKSGEPSSLLLKFLERVGAELSQDGEGYFCVYNKNLVRLPCHEPLETHVVATIDNLDHVKMHLISLGWKPSEWRERDLTKDSKKQSIPYEKRVLALERWASDTFEGKYKQDRLEIVGIKEEFLIEKLKERLREDKPVRVPTSPCVRVGVEKELCPNLTALGDKVAFANDFSLYLTYKHRKASIAGGDVEDMDFDLETPNTGFLSMYRESDGRVSTPAIEIGASTNRYRHIGIVNVARASSIYGKEMRSLFGSGVGALQLGYDFASLEARIEGHYVWKYTGGQDLAVSLLAEKPNDIHTLTGVKLNIPRSDAKSINYGIIYGAAVKKISKMLNCSMEKAKEIFDGFWEAVPALKELKDAVEKYWQSTDRKFIPGIDGRKIFIRSSHSILNALLQSGGVICAKYVAVLMMQELEEKGYCIDPFIGKPDVCSMIEMHDEQQLYVNPSLVKFETFSSEEEASSFIESWKGDQLSAISQGNTWYVALPNDVSKAIDNSIRKTGDLLKLNVPLGYEWIVNKTWYGCH